MKTTNGRSAIEHELGIYDAIHRSPLNRLLHAVGIPTIMFSVVGAAALLRGPGEGVAGHFVNGGIALSILSGIIIGRLGLRSGVALAAFGFALTWAASILQSYVGTPTAGAIFAAAFVIGWIIQFIGHAIERAGPAFGSRPINLLLGPVSVLNDFLPLVRPAPWRSDRP